VSKILLIGGYDASHQALTRTLETAGYEVLKATGRSSAIAGYVRVQPRLVIADIPLPRKDGTTTIASFETVMALRRANPGLKILAISGGRRSGVGTVLDVARTVGADEVLRKPHRKADLLDVVKRLLGSA
jgi:two-component system chemotaxis response regulator CheY